MDETNKTTKLPEVDTVEVFPKSKPTKSGKWIEMMDADGNPVLKRDGKTPQKFWQDDGMISQGTMLTTKEASDRLGKDHTTIKRALSRRNAKQKITKMTAKGEMLANSRLVVLDRHGNYGFDENALSVLNDTSSSIPASEVVDYDKEKLDLMRENRELSQENRELRDKLNAKTQDVIKQLVQLYASTQTPPSAVRQIETTGQDEVDDETKAFRLLADSYSELSKEMKRALRDKEQAIQDREDALQDNERLREKLREEQEKSGKSFFAKLFGK